MRGFRLTLELTEFDQGQPKRHGFRMVYAQHFNRRPADRCQSRQARAIPNEVFCPLVIPWMKKPSHLACRRVDA